MDNFKTSIIDGEDKILCIIEKEGKYTLVLDAQVKAEFSTIEVQFLYRPVDGERKLLSVALPISDCITICEMTGFGNDMLINKIIDFEKKEFKELDSIDKGISCGTFAPVLYNFFEKFAK